MATEKENKPQPGTEEAKAPAPAAAPAKAPVPAAATASSADSEKKRSRKPGVPPRRGKKLRNHLKNQVQRIAKEGVVTPKKAIGTLKSMKRVKFDETIEVHMKLGIDPNNSDQMVRGSVPLPHGIGKSVRVLVFCQGDEVAKAKAAGADFAGSTDVIEKIQKEGWLDFDVAITTQAMMPQVSRLGKVLGPRGLMPTPKAGTVVPTNGDIGAVVKEFKAGKVEYRADKTGCIHAGIGKMSFDDEKLLDNFKTFVDQVKAAKPSGVKGHFVESITLSATMSPGIHVNI